MALGSCFHGRAAGESVQDHRVVILLAINFQVLDWLGPAADRQ